MQRYVVGDLYHSGNVELDDPLSPTDGENAICLPDDIRPSAHLLSPIAEAVADFFSSADPALVRKCANPACILVFYDTTKNHTSRWCSMGVCGNRMEVAAHARRTGGQQQGG